MESSNQTEERWSEPTGSPPGPKANKSERPITVGRDPHSEQSIVVTPRADTEVRVVKGGNHVTTLLAAQATGHSLDAIVVKADPGGGPTPHCHTFGEWSHVLEGTCQITTEENGEIAPFATASAGDSVWVPPNAWHGTTNASRSRVDAAPVERPVHRQRRSALPQESCVRPRTLPSGSVKVATRRPPPTLRGGTFTVAPAAVTSASFASISVTCQ